MAEDTVSRNDAAAAPAAMASMAPAATAAPARRRGGTGLVLGTALVAFVLGAGAVGYAVWEGMLPLAKPVAPVATPVAAPTVAPAIADAPQAALAAREDTLEGRIGALEQRLELLGPQADAAAAKAVRAEALLVAIAARRALDRGAPLGYLEDQLRLRFGDAQPNAVATVIDAARTPLTLEELLAGLDALGPTLAQAPDTAGPWQQLRHEIAGLFVFRRESAPSPAPKALLERARLLIEAGRTSDAINAVSRLPGAAEARDWMVAARRYDSARRALDVLETSALLDGQITAEQAPAAPVAASPRPAPAPRPAETPPAI